MVIRVLSLWMQLLAPPAKARRAGTLRFQRGTHLMLLA